MKCLAKGVNKKKPIILVVLIKFRHFEKINEPSALCIRVSYTRI